MTTPTSLTNKIERGLFSAARLRQLFVVCVVTIVTLSACADETGGVEQSTIEPQAPEPLVLPMPYSNLESDLLGDWVELPEFENDTYIIRFEKPNITTKRWVKDEHIASIGTWHIEGANIIVDTNSNTNRPEPSTYRIGGGSLLVEHDSFGYVEPRFRKLGEDNRPLPITGSRTELKSLFNSNEVQSISILNGANVSQVLGHYGEMFLDGVGNSQPITAIDERIELKRDGNKWIGNYILYIAKYADYIEGHDASVFESLPISIPNSSITSILEASIQIPVEEGTWNAPSDPPAAELTVTFENGEYVTFQSVWGFDKGNRDALGIKVSSVEDSLISFDNDSVVSIWEIAEPLIEDHRESGKELLDEKILTGEKTKPVDNPNAQWLIGEWLIEHDELDVFLAFQNPDILEISSKAIGDTDPPYITKYTWKLFNDTVYFVDKEDIQWFNIESNNRLSDVYQLETYYFNKLAQDQTP